jgi:hypothetical protein
LKPAENIAESQQIARGGFGENHSAGSPAGAVADASSFEHDHGFFRRVDTKRCRGRKSGEAGADNREINFVWKRLPRGREVNFPRRLAPAVEFGLRGGH